MNDEQIVEFLLEEEQTSGQKFTEAELDEAIETLISLEE